MKNECSIVRDLLPLYAEKMVSDDTAAFVAEHLQSCAACRRELEQGSAPEAAKSSDEALPLRTLSRKLRAKRLQTVALTAVFVAALIVSALSVLWSPVYFPHSEGLVTVEPYGDTGVLLRFDRGVTHFHVDVHSSPYGGVARWCDIEAWTTLWDTWFPRETAPLSTFVEARGVPLRLFYVSNDGNENICLANYDPDSEPQIELDGKAAGGTTLPRLAMGYYLLLACGALAVAGIVWLSTRKRAAVRVWVERVGLYPAAYIVSHCVISGVDWTTYSITYDFTLTVFLSILLYGGFLLAHNVLYLRREIRALGG